MTLWQQLSFICPRLPLNIIIYLLFSLLFSYATFVSCFPFVEYILYWLMGINHWVCFVSTISAIVAQHRRHHIKANSDCRPTNQAPPKTKSGHQTKRVKSKSKIIYIHIYIDICLCIIDKYICIYEHFQQLPPPKQKKQSKTKVPKLISAIAMADTIKALTCVCACVYRRYLSLVFRMLGIDSDKLLQSSGVMFVHVWFFAVSVCT